MKITTKSLTRLILGTIAGITVVSSLSQSSWAQTTDVDPLEDLNTAEESTDPFSRTGQGGSFGVFDLIHRANLGGDRNPEDFSLEQNQNLSTAAAEFRKKQLERLQQPQATPATPVTTPQVAN